MAALTPDASVSEAYVALRDGRVVHLRAILPSDEKELCRHLRECPTKPATCASCDRFVSRTCSACARRLSRFRKVAAESWPPCRRTMEATSWPALCFSS